MHPRHRSRTLATATMATLVAVVAAGCISVHASPAVITTDLGVPAHVCVDARPYALPDVDLISTVHWDWGDGHRDDVLDGKWPTACADHTYGATGTYRGHLWVDYPSPVQPQEALAATFTVTVQGASDALVTLIAEPVPGERNIVWVRVAQARALFDCPVRDLTVLPEATAAPTTPLRLTVLDGQAVAVPGPGTYRLALRLSCTAWTGPNLEALATTTVTVP